jgi:hypothetical protein
MTGKRRNPHAPSPRGWRDWYQLEAWRRRRRLQLQAEPLCRMCLEHGITKPATIADHIRKHGGEFTRFMTDPLQSLCGHCHNSHKRKIELRGYSDEIGVDGWPVDPRHPANRTR